MCWCRRWGSRGIAFPRASIAAYTPRMGTPDANAVVPVLQAVLFFDRDPAYRVEFEVARRAEYFDVLPYILDYRHQVGAEE